MLYLDVNYKIYIYIQVLCYFKKCSLGFGCFKLSLFSVGVCAKNIYFLFKIAIAEALQDYCIRGGQHKPMHYQVKSTSLINVGLYLACKNVKCDEVYSQRSSGNYSKVSRSWRVQATTLVSLHYEVIVGHPMFISEDRETNY